MIAAEKKFSEQNSAYTLAVFIPNVTDAENASVFLLISTIKIGEFLLRRLLTKSLLCGIINIQII